MYLGQAAYDVLDQVQADIERHAVSSADGLCLTCRTTGPCETYENASRTFMRYGQMPRRRPGLSRPQLLGARRVGIGQGAR
jgi:hypothetical protein